MATSVLEQPAGVPKIVSQPKPVAPWLPGITRLAIAVVIVGVAWRVLRYLAAYPLWGDEAFLALNFLDKGFWELAEGLDYYQVAPILFVWTEWLMCQCFGTSELVLRFFPLVAGVAGLLLFWRLCRLTLPPVAAALAVSLLAVSYYPVRHATEIKPYAFDLFWAVALLLPAVSWLRKPERLSRLVWLALLTPPAIGGSFTAVFVAGAISLVLLPRVARAGWAARGWYLAFNLGMAGSFFVQVSLVGQGQAPEQRAALHQYWQEWFAPANGMAWPLWLLQAHTGNMFAYPIGGPRGASSLTFVLCLAGLWMLARGRRPGLIVLCTGPFVLSLAAAVAGRYPYGGSARLAQHLAPAICMLAGLGIVHLLGFVRRLSLQRGATVVMAGCLLLGVAGITLTILKPYKNAGDVTIRDMAHELAAKVQPGDAVIVFHPPDFVRSNMTWYLRVQGFAILWNGRIDNELLQTRRHIWGIALRSADEPVKTPPPLLSASRSAWSPVERTEYTFTAESKDVPMQICDVFFWTRRDARISWACAGLLRQLLIVQHSKREG